MYGQLGSVVFEGLFALQTKAETFAGRYPEMSKINQKATLQFTGPELDTISLGIYMHREFIDPKTIIDEFKTYNQTGQIIPFLDGDGKYYGKFVVVSGTVEDEIWDTNGQLIAANLSLEIKEFTDDPSVTESTSFRSAAIAISENNPTPELRVDVSPVALLETINLTIVARSNSTDSIALVDTAVADSVRADSILGQIGNKMKAGVASAEKAIDNIRNNPKYGATAPSLELSMENMISSAKAMESAAKNGNLNGVVQQAKILTANLVAVDQAMLPVNILTLLRKRL